MSFGIGNVKNDGLITLCCVAGTGVAQEDPDSISVNANVVLLYP
jgi:hypothetical protein